MLVKVGRKVVNISSIVGNIVLFISMMVCFGNFVNNLGSVRVVIMDLFL